MTIAHLCIQCGRDLARIRSIREPHYDLPIITCPRCTTVAVRRMHPIQQAWRSFLRLKSSLVVFFFKLTVAVLLIVFTVAVANIGAHSIRGSFTRVDLFWGAMLALVTGIWLTAGLAHLSRWKAWLGWVVVLLVAHLVYDVAAVFAIVNSFEWPGVREELHQHLASRGWSILVMALLLAVSTVSIPLGILLRHVFEHNRRTRWRKRRHRLRRKRENA